MSKPGKKFATGGFIMGTVQCAPLEKGLAWTAQQISRNKAQAPFDKLDVEIIRGLADNNMKVTETANAMYIHRNTVLYRAKRVQKKTGIDPFDFYGLCKLLMLVGQMERIQDNGQI